MDISNNQFNNSEDLSTQDNIQGSIQLFISEEVFEETSLLDDIFIYPSLDSMVVLIDKTYFGSKENQLTKNLLKSFFIVMSERETKPSTFIFISEGVKLTCGDSEILNFLKSLEEEGVSIMVCGESLNFLEIREKLAIGYISNMYDIAEVLMKTSKLISL